MISHLISHLPAGLAAGHPYRMIFLPLALSLILAEYLFHRVNDIESYNGGETVASLALAGVNRAAAALTAGLAAIPMLFVYRHRLFDIPLTAAWSVLALFIAVEFSYYVHHVAMHKVRWLWATHGVHHTPTRLNLSAAVRLGPGAHLTGGFLFYLPAVAVGFHPAAVIGTLSLGLFYQFFLHLARAPRLGPLEWVLNTPRHHQVHHACNPGCVDRNFGAVLIVSDRMFGTFAHAPADETLRFGTSGTAPSVNPLKIVFDGWREMFADAHQAEGAAAKLRALFGRP
jgi:sterol desaturase/sphingolipid hydroxylase (fatty acid hydroxylase superfamily)